MIKAKEVSNNFWILKDGNIKVGEINNFKNGGTILSLKGKHKEFPSIQYIKDKTNIVFDNTEYKVNDVLDDIHGYPYIGEAFDPMWDLNLQLPLYIKTEDSKSWFAAGWYMVKIRNKWQSILCPKLIILQRNEYLGPYKTDPKHDSY